MIILFGCGVVAAAGSYCRVRFRPLAMHYVKFRDRIEEELQRNPNGLTWAALQKRLDLPYSRPCPSWIRRMETEIGLSRTRRSGPALIWKLNRHHLKARTAGC